MAKWRRKIPWLFCIVLLVSCQPGPVSQEPDLPELPFSADLQTAITEALADGQEPYELGVSAAVIVPGYEVWTGVGGISHPGEPITPDTLFDVGSVQKNFEAALVLKMAEEDLLSLDDPISLYLPALPNADGGITIRQLLDHSSGVFNVFEHPDFPWIRVDVDYARSWELEEVFDNFVLEPYGPPGHVQHYSSTNYLLLTAIVEKVSGFTVPEELGRYFLGPMNLANTYVTMDAPPPEQYTVAHPWVDLERDRQLEDLYGISLAWKSTLTHPTLFSTAGDLARWMHALFYHRTVLAPESLDEMLAYPEVTVRDPEGGRYGLGVVDYSASLGMNVIGHMGSSLGYVAAALYLPEYGVTVVILINAGESPQPLGGWLLYDSWSAIVEVLREQGIVEP